MNRVFVGIVVVVMFILFFAISNFLNDREADLLLKAQQSGDVSLCGKTVDETNRRSCIIGVAIEKKDLKICDKYLPEMNEGCYLMVATNTEDVTLCDHIKDDFNSFECRRAIAVRTNNLSICEAMDNEGYRNSCLQSAETAFK